MKTISILALIIPVMVFGITEKEIDSKIENVTVFFKGAQINRSAKINLSSGSYEIVISGLENNIDNNSIQIRGNGTTVPPPRELYSLCSHPMS